MPLSEHEQRILADIEARLAADDPRLASTVSQTTVAAHARRQLKLAALVFAAGFVLLVAGIANIVVGIIGFVVMLAATASAARSYTRLRAEQGTPTVSGGAGHPDGRRTNRER